MSVIFRLENGERGLVVAVCCAECETVIRRVAIGDRTWSETWRCGNQECE